MLEKSEGIILQNYKYGESSVVSHIFTEKLGRKSFIFKGVRTKKSPQKSNLLLPLQILNLDFYYHEHRDLLIIKEFNREGALSNFHYDPLKSAQAMLLAEILDKCLYEETQNPDLFQFLKTSILYFDLKNTDTSNFHLSFLMKLTKYLGILPELFDSGDEIFFDLLEGRFIKEKPLHQSCCEPKNSALLLKLLTSQWETGSKIPLNAIMRKSLLQNILQYYSIHNYKVQNIKSLDILIEIFNS